MSRQLPIKRTCACGCGREFYIGKNMAWWYGDENRYAMFRIDCENMPDMKPVRRLNKYLIFEYAQEVQDVSVD